MSNEIEFLYIGWCNRTKDGVKSDKVWASFRLNGRYYACWGARGKSVRFKEHDDIWSVRTTQFKKEMEYDEVTDSFILFSMFPTFKEDVAKKLTFDIMANKVMPA
jgi:hypothetical protein